ncbi:uncharacterized protein LOC119866557 [Canis lupus familiaris]|uniref:uncharacterized protein LOC119866557 n=1 Tax=Canis lupus familiaris TaxID=9615 RepID=UPI0018F7D69A|nr:uncharacterized protein LOC119866557 [Canis lupus familiaris]
MPCLGMDFDSLRRFPRPATSLGREDSATGPGTSVPQRGPSWSSNVHRKPRNKDSRHTEMAGAANYEASRPAKARAQASERRAPPCRAAAASAPEAAQTRGSKSGPAAERLSRRQSARAAPGAPPPGRVPSHSAQPGFRVSAAPRLPDALPHPSHQTPLRRGAGCPVRSAHLPRGIRHLEERGSRH